MGQYAESLDMITRSFDKSMRSRLLLTFFTAISLSVLLIVILWQAIHTLRRKREIERLKDSYLEINRQLTIGSTTPTARWCGPTTSSTTPTGSNRST